MWGSGIFLWAQSFFLPCWCNWSSLSAHCDPAGVRVGKSWSLFPLREYWFKEHWFLTWGQIFGQISLLVPIVVTCTSPNGPRKVDWCLGYQQHFCPQYHPIFHSNTCSAHLLHVSVSLLNYTQPSASLPLLCWVAGVRGCHRSYCGLLVVGAKLIPMADHIHDHH